MITDFKLFENRGINKDFKKYIDLIYNGFLSGIDKIMLDIDENSIKLTNLRIELEKSNINHGTYKFKSDEDFERIVSKLDS